MRPLPILSAVLVTAATPVFAQVTVDLRALQALPERPAAARPARQPPPAVIPDSPAISARGNPPATVVQPEAPVQPKAPAQPALPEAVPNLATIAPITPPPAAAGSPPPPPPPVSDTATTAAAPTIAGLRLTFAPGQSDLSPESAASIKQLAEAATPGEATMFNVSAYAPGKPDDPSTARRMSLSRAMAVRSALVAGGVPSARIFVRALGEQHGDGPPDRVDVNVMGANSPADTATVR
jgi:outer membrane protein OmpA-like peptidoglycan-associated protein